MKTIYKVIWDNGNANGALSEVFDNAKDAEDYARDWKRSMVAIETNSKDRREAAGAYSWDIIESQEFTENEKLEAEYAEEASYDYFNRHIAGDR